MVYTKLDTCSTQQQKPHEVGVNRSPVSCKTEEVQFSQHSCKMGNKGFRHSEVHTHSAHSCYFYQQPMKKESSALQLLQSIISTKKSYGVHEALLCPVCMSIASITFETLTPTQVPVKIQQSLVLWLEHNAILIIFAMLPAHEP